MSKGIDLSASRHGLFVCSEQVRSEQLPSELPALALLRERPEALEAQAQRRVPTAVSRYFDLVWRSLRRFGVPERAADDAAQQVFLTFSQRLDAVAPDGERPFLIAVAARVAANVRRKLERSKEVLSDELELAANQHTPEDLLDQKQRLEELERALATLPFEQRTVFVLYEIEGFSLPEIAESLEIPLGTATSRLRRARDKFESWVVARGNGGGEP